MVEPIFFCLFQPIFHKNESLTFYSYWHLTSTLFSGQPQKLQLIPLHRCSSPHTELSASLENVHEATRHGDQEDQVFYNSEQFFENNKC